MITKLVYEFDLPDDQGEFDLHIENVKEGSAGKYYLQLSNIDNKLRSIIKYSELSDDVIAFAEEIRGMIRLDD